MNILFTMVNGKPSKNKGGGEKIIYLLAKSLLKKNINCHFLSTEFYIQFDKEFFKIDELILTKSKLFINKVLKYQFFIRIYYLYPFFVIHFFIKKIRYLVKINNFRNFDIIHAHEPLSLYFIPKRKEKRILTIHTKGSFIDELQQKYSFISLSVLKFLRNKEEKGINTADIITFPSNYAMNLFLVNYDFISINNIKVINNGIEKSIGSSNYMLENLLYEIKNKFDFILLNVANHIYEKRIDILLKIVRELINIGKNPFLLNVGEGIKTNKLLALAKDLGISENIKFLGKIQNNEVHYLMQECDFLVMTSEKSIFDLTILEALQNKCRIICNKDGGNSEIIINGLNGYLVENNIVSEYVNLILNFDDKVLENVSKSSKNYSIEKMCNNFVDLYERTTRSK